MQTILRFITLKNLGRLGLCAFIASAVALAGCKSSPDRTSGQQMSDRQISRGVKKALKNDTTFKYADVQPVVYNGTIQLTGFVETDEQRLRAAELAAQTKGAKQVINAIMIKATPTGRAIIRDPLAHETGYLLVDTNAPVLRMRNLPATGQPQEQPKSDTAPGTEGSAPKQ
jgi:hypothetical protein